MIDVFDSKSEQDKAAADLFISCATKAINNVGRFSVALTGGSSPVGLYRLLAQESYKEKINWNRTYVFWSDERWVPVDDERSNAGMTFHELLNHVPLPRSQIYPMWDPTIPAVQFATEYERLIQRHFNNEKPAFDLIMLGMGEDGHTASLFPGEAVIREESKWVDAYYLAAQDMYRITFTARLINEAKNILILLFGAAKSEVLYEVLEGESNPEKYPAQLIDPREGNVYWYIDKAAAKKLPYYRDV